VKRIAIAACACLFAASCGSSQADRVMASINEFHFVNARYEERCVPEGPKGCAATSAALKKWSSGIGEAKDGLKRGGKITLQVSYVEKLGKEAKKCLPK